MYEKIINEIKLNLGENKDLNKKYLSSQMEKYKDHEFNVEILRELSRMMWDCLSDEEKQEFIEISQNETPIMDILEEIFPLIENEKNDEALDKLNSFMLNFSPMFEDDSINEYHYFTNHLEEEIFNEYIDAKKDVRYIPNNQPLLDLYYVYGFLFLETKNFNKAEEYLKKALKINPISSRILLELSEVYKGQSLNKYFFYTTQALKYAYYPQDIARCYRNLGFYYIEAGEYKVSASLYNFSMKYELSPLAYKELQYLKTKGEIVELELSECLEALNEKNIQIDTNPFILKTLHLLADKFDKDQALPQALYYYELEYDLTHNEKILEKINELRKVI